MTRLIEFETDQNGTILIEAADDEPSEGQREVSVHGVLVEKTGVAFEAAFAGIKPIARSIITQIREVATGASEIEVEFGVKLTAAAGAVLAKAGAEGHCRVSIKWNLDPAAKTPTTAL